MSDGARVRACAAGVLHSVLAGASLRETLEAERRALEDSRDRALLTALVLAALRHHFRYRALRESLLSRPPGARQAVVLALIDIGFAQLDALAMPPHAGVAATVAASRLLGQPRLAGLVNALLRRFLRERETLLASVATRAEVACEHPDWLRRCLAADWGEAASSIMAANLQAPPLWLRVNASGGTRLDCAERLRASGYSVRVPSAPAQALCLPEGVDPTALPGFAEGHFSVQDGAAQWAAPLLDARPGQRVLDACSAPGGKTAHLLELAGNRLDLLALDVDASRLKRVADTLARLHLDAELRVADAAATATWWDGRPFDRILLDAPCSGSGVIRRHPDIRLHRRAGDIATLCAQQARLLDALWPMLEPGGRLVYVTCSVLRDENDRQIDAFLARHRDAVVAEPTPLAPGRRVGTGWQILPGEEGMDGFFFALLERRPAADTVERLR